MRLNYVLMDPTGNMTILVETPVPAASQSFCAAKLLETEPAAEQVGFISASGGQDCDTVLRMAGGEFCGNAAMCAAVLYAMRTGMTEGTPAQVMVSVAETQVSVKLELQPEGTACCEALLPGPRHVGEYAGLPLVELPGISHLIVTAPMEKAAAETAVRDHAARLNAEALGLLLLDEAAGTMTPLVYVPGVDTMFWENSCASGTAAVGAYLARREGRRVTCALAEPAGTLTVSAAPEGPVLLRGTVRLTRTGSAEIELPGELG